MTSGWGGAEGVALYRGERFWKLATAENPPLLNVSGWRRTAMVDCGQTAAPG